MENADQKLLYTLPFAYMYMAVEEVGRLAEASLHLSKSDPVMADLIADIGPCTLAKEEDYYASLLAAIINQQLSGSAADSIYGRLIREAGSRSDPNSIAGLSPEQFRRAGVSRSKEGFIRGLSSAFIKDGGFLKEVDQKNDQEVLSILTGLNGVGTWTAHMFMIFSLNRLDILPLGDAGFRRAVSKFYLEGRKPDDSEIIEISKKWAPYRSIAVWYLWRGIDSAPKGPIQKRPAPAEGDL